MADRSVWTVRQSNIHEIRSAATLIQDFCWAGRLSVFCTCARKVVDVPELFRHYGRRQGADPPWLPHLRRHQHLVARIFAFGKDTAALTDNQHERLLMTDVLHLLSHENTKMLNRPAYGISEAACTLKYCGQAVHAWCQRRPSLLIFELFQSRLAPFMEE